MRKTTIIESASFHPVPTELGSFFRLPADWLLPKIDLRSRVCNDLQPAKKQCSGSARATQIFVSRGEAKPHRSFDRANSIGPPRFVPNRFSVRFGFECAIRMYSTTYAKKWLRLFEPSSTRQAHRNGFENSNPAPRHPASQTTALPPGLASNVQNRPRTTRIRSSPPRFPRWLRTCITRAVNHLRRNWLRFFFSRRLARPATVGSRNNPSASGSGYFALVLRMDFKSPSANAVVK